MSNNEKQMPNNPLSIFDLDIKEILAEVDELNDLLKILNNKNKLFYDALKTYAEYRVIENKTCNIEFTDNIEELRKNHPETAELLINDTEKRRKLIQLLKKIVE